MSDEIRLAFDHPAARAEAMAGADPLDRISLRDHIVEVEIGAFQIERDVTQRLSFNVVVEVRAPGGETDDDVDRILSYDRVTEAIAAELGVERLALLETLAERVADRILVEPQAERVFVRIEKLDRGPGALGVEIVRSRQVGAREALEAGKPPQPQIVFLSNPAIFSAYLSGWLDQLVAGAPPVILCVGAPEVEIPQVASPAAQRRIDLLAIEQNAWALSARDDRCVVAGTRTELDWAMKNGQTSVWAPSKMVLDAVDMPSSVQSRDAAALAVWFAGEINALGLLAIDAKAPLDANIPVRSVALDQAKL